MGVPANPIVVCGSGPSLLTVPFDGIGLPYSAVSTAIKYTPEPEHWLLVDRMNRAHQRAPHSAQERGIGGTAAWRSKEIVKVVPQARQRYFKDCPSEVIGVHRDKQTEFLGGDPDHLHYCFNRSMLFAVEWLSWRYDCLIFAGIDLQVDPNQEFLNQRKARSKVNSRNHSHRIEYGHWERFAGLAKAKGVLWLNWTPGGPLGHIMEDFDDWRRRHQGDGVPSWVSTSVQPPRSEPQRGPAGERVEAVVCPAPVPRPAPHGRPRSPRKRRRR